MRVLNSGRGMITFAKNAGHCCDGALGNLKVTSLEAGGSRLEAVGVMQTRTEKELRSKS